MCTQSVGNATDSLDVSVKTVLEVIGRADLDEELSVSSQMEICTCEGGYCNGAIKIEKMAIFAVTALCSLLILIVLTVSTSL